MAGNWIRNIRDRVTDAFGTGLCRIEQRSGFIEDLFSVVTPDLLRFLLPQRRRQAHHAFQPVCAHDARLLINKVTAGRTPKVSYFGQNQHVWRKNAGLLIDLAGPELMSARRYSPERYKRRPGR